MSKLELRLTYIDGPTALIEWGGLRFLTDPTFDPAGGDYRTSAYTLRKTRAPALLPDALGALDAVLLSHDHHFDNLDTAGRLVLGGAARVLTTQAGAERLGSGAQGMAPWQTYDIPAPDGRALRVTATPARHGPPQADRGPVIGFALAFNDQPESTVYISGDTVWYEGVAEVSRRFPVSLAILFMGAAQVAAAGPWPLTMTADEGVEAARAFPAAAIVPLHFEGWAHFTESRPEIEAAFARAGLSGRLRWPEPGHAWRFTP